MTTFTTADASPRGDDGLQFVTVQSPALGRRGDLTVWTPSTDAGPLPLVTLLHGVYGSHWGWSANGRAHVAAAKLIADGTIPPMALAMPSDGLWGHGSGYVAHDDADYESWIVDEVPAAVARAGIEIQDRPGGIVGLSMGGFGAVRLGFRHPDRYTAVVGLSAITTWSRMATFVGDLSQYPEPDDPDLIDLVCATDAGPALRLDCGAQDLLIDDNRLLHQQLDEHAIGHEYVEHDGGHDWAYWSAHVGESLAFVGRAFEAAA